TRARNDEYTWEYAFASSASRFDSNIGMTIFLGGNLKKTSGFLHTGLGVTVYDYRYFYKKYDAAGNPLDIMWLRNKDVSGTGLNLELTGILNIKWFYLELGGQVIVPKLRESAFMIGIGGSW